MAESTAADQPTPIAVHGRSLANLTDPQAVLQAIGEADTLGHSAFLREHGFRSARTYFLEYEGRRYDSKAIAGVAFGYQHGARPLAAHEFSGGENTVKRKLEQLGFNVVEGSPSHPQTVQQSPDATFAAVWERIKECVGQQFETTNGLPFTYAVEHDVVRVAGRPRTRVHISQFRNALGRMPVGSPTTLGRDVWGASYVFAILADRRMASPPMAAMEIYWWSGDATERYWVEIRKVPGLGTELRCPMVDGRGRRNGWYDLLTAVRQNDVVYHWHARESRFVGRSIASSRVQAEGDERVIPLLNFQPLVGDVDLAALRTSRKQIDEVRTRLSQEHPNAALYLPFQFRKDGIRMMSNYFAKLPSVLVEALFGTSGLADEGGAEPATEDGPAIDGVDYTQTNSRHLEPFKPKADAEYVAFVRGGPQKRGRLHEKLVNDFTEWLVQRGLQPGRNRAIDIGLVQPSVIVEAKMIGTWAIAIRQAVAQLYEYRYFQVVPRDTSLVFLSSESVPARWLQYLETDRDIGVAWRAGDGFAVSDKAKNFLGL